MPKTIWKFPLELEDGQVISMPKGAEILTVQAQNNSPCLWAIVDPTADNEFRSIDIRGTGHPLPMDPGTYIGTFQMHGGRLVFHVFEEQR